LSLSIKCSLLYHTSSTSDCQKLHQTGCWKCCEASPLVHQEGKWKSIGSQCCDQPCCTPSYTCEDLWQDQQTPPRRLNKKAGHHKLIAQVRHRDRTLASKPCGTCQFVRLLCTATQMHRPQIQGSLSHFLVDTALIQCPRRCRSSPCRDMSLPLVAIMQAFAAGFDTKQVSLGAPPPPPFGSV